MAEALALSTAPDAMQDVISDAPAVVPEIPQEPERISETLYIQNLNEKIKVDGSVVSA